ncbi:hypothetical protein DQ04_25571000, partial [Trypanosoma grayi]|uniref:hypothetical protein n=1 Tax=Trypanosoma grayi TaxID=71804 RepID=UPI0004F3F99C
DTVTFLNFGTIRFFFITVLAWGSRDICHAVASTHCRISRRSFGTLTGRIALILAGNLLLLSPNTPAATPHAEHTHKQHVAPHHRRHHCSYTEKKRAERN